MAEKQEEGAPAEKPVAKIVRGNEREKTIPLEWEIEFEGRVYDSITIRRCTGFEISEYVLSMAEGNAPMFPGLDCPIAVYEALDADDFEKVDEVVRDFLPRRFRQAAEPTSEASDNMSTKSGTPSAEAGTK